MYNHKKLNHLFLLFFGLSSFLWLFYQSTLGNEKIIKDAHFLRIATYNIRRQGKEKLRSRKWKKRLPTVIQTIKAIQPDIIGFQEPIKQQVADLAVQLKNYAWFGSGRGKSYLGFGTDEYNPIFYNKKRFILRKKGTFRINCKSLFKRHTQGLLPRICTWGIFEVKETGEKIYVYNTHLDHKFSSARCNQLKNIITMMKQHNVKNGNNIVLLGDFNTELDGKVRPILDEMKLHNTKELAKKRKGPEITSPGWDNKDPRCIDHILANKDKKQTKVNQHVVLQQTKQQSSDHYPVFVDLCFSQN
jgi:endonuclease/exonuclease/phosphatase family metal-dependent hydrolase